MEGLKTGERTLLTNVCIFSYFWIVFYWICGILSWEEFHGGQENNDG